MYELETGIPVPRRKTHHSKYPFSEMKVGQSFVAFLIERRRVSSAASARYRREGIRFRIRKISDTEIRIWRVS